MSSSGTGTMNRRTVITIQSIAIAILALCAFPRGSSAQACVDPSIRGFRWCKDDIPVYLGPGMAGNNPWKLAIETVIHEINAEAAVDLATPLFLTIAGGWDAAVGPQPGGINIHVATEVVNITCGIEDDIAATKTYSTAPLPPEPAPNLRTASFGMAA